MYKKHFIEKPNLPSNTVTTAIISERYTKFSASLNQLGITVINSPSIEDINGAEKFHADISAIHVGDNNIICAKNNQGLIKKLQKIGLNVIPSYNNIIGNYPSCTALNAVVIEKYIICRKKFIDYTIFKYFKNNFEFLNVKQGYSRCSTAIVSKNSIITSDEGIYNISIKNKIDALKISSGGILIDGYDYGFIGGTCGKLSYDILAFCGKIENHKDYLNIKAFSRNHGVYLISLSNDPLFDVGGILPILEK